MARSTCGMISRITSDVLNRELRPALTRPTGSQGAGGSTSPAESAGGVRTLCIQHLAHIERARPAQLGKLALVCVEHERARMLVPELDNAALALAQCHRIRHLVLRRRTRAVVAEN